MPPTPGPREGSGMPPSTIRIVDIPPGDPLSFSRFSTVDRKNLKASSPPIFSWRGPPVAWAALPGPPPCPGTAALALKRQ